MFRWSPNHHLGIIFPRDYKKRNDQIRIQISFLARSFTFSNHLSTETESRKREILLSGWKVKRSCQRYSSTDAENRPWSSSTVIHSVFAITSTLSPPVLRKMAKWNHQLGMSHEPIPCSMVQNRKNTEKIAIKSFTVPRTREWVNERANERAKWIVRSKRTSERCERTEERVAQYFCLDSWLFNSGP